MGYGYEMCGSKIEPGGKLTRSSYRPAWPLTTTSWWSTRPTASSPPWSSRTGTSAGSDGKVDATGCKHARDAAPESTSTVTEMVRKEHGGDLITTVGEVQSRVHATEGIAADQRLRFSGRALDRFIAIARTASARGTRWSLRCAAPRRAAARSPAPCSSRR